MGLLSRLTGRAETQQPEQEASTADSVSNVRQWIVRMLGAKVASKVDVNEWTALALPVVYACVGRIANPIGVFPVDVYRLESGEKIEAPEHPAHAILNRRPNPHMTPRTLRKTTQGHALLWGNGYLEVARNGRGEARQLWPLLPWATESHRSHGERRFRTTIDGQGFSLPERDVIHIMDMSLDGYTGLSQIFMAREALGLARAAEKFGAKFFANDARSGGFLQHPSKLSDKAKKNIRDEHSGDGVERTALDDAFRVKVLEEGMKYISTTIPPDDAQFLGTRQYQTEEIARIYNVPLFLLQSHEKDTSWGSGLEQMMIAFVTHTLEPWVVAWEQELNWKLFTDAEREQGYFVKFNMNALLRGDMQARAAFYEKALDPETGWMNRPEVREKEDLPAEDVQNERGNDDAD